ncbi:type VII secretion integral membrane protein EccD [Amycolatopsis sp. NPDC058986]|uniref:type VII secretion integral membrane protein EccD n=1 Tax=unclassified Amycolatopsis TaxID=2618356 RepID=UPI00366FB65F
MPHGQQGAVRPGGTSDGFCRLTVAGPATRADISVPATVPLAQLLPMLLQHVLPDRPPDGGAAHGGWVLARGDGTRLDPARGLAANGVREGELLFLRPADERGAAPLYDDVVEVIGAGAVTSTWDTRAARVACGVIGVLTGLGAAALLLSTGGRTAGFLGVTLAALLLLGGGALARAAGDLAAGTVTAALAAPVGAAGSSVLLTASHTGAHVLLASAVVLVVAALGAVVVGGGDGTFAALAVVGLSGLLGALVALPASGTPERAAAVVAPLALALTTAMPTLALRLARLPRPSLPRNAQDVAQVTGQSSWDETSRRIDQARRLLTGLVAGINAVVAAGIVLLALGGTWPMVLAGVLLALVALRARLFAERAQRLASMAATAAALVALLAAVIARFAGDQDVMLGIVLPTVVLLGVFVGLAAIVQGRSVTGPRGARWLDIAESVLLLAVVPLVLAVWDIYAALMDIG